MWKVFKEAATFGDTFFEKDVLAVKQACQIATAFNLRNADLPQPRPRVYINVPEVWTEDGSGRKGLVEPLIAGTYHKFNSNSGWMNSDFLLMQALSHSSFHITDGSCLLCDLQGGFCEGVFTLTDPVVLSKGRLYGVTDGGEEAMEQWFANHRCNQYCDPSWKRLPGKQSRFAVRSSTTFFPQARSRLHAQLLRQSEQALPHGLIQVHGQFGQGHNDCGGCIPIRLRSIRREQAIRAKVVEAI